MKKILVLLALIFILCRVGITQDLAMQWTETVATADTSTTDTNTAYSKSIPTYGYLNENAGCKYYYNTFQVDAIPLHQETRNCSVTVIVEYSPNDSTWTVFDSVTFDAVSRDSSLARADTRIKLDSTVTHANYFRAKAIQWTTYTAADTLVVGLNYIFRARVWMSPRW